MRWSASDQALGVMRRPTVHRRSELLGTSIGTSFNGFLGLALCATPSPPILTSSVLLVLADGRYPLLVYRARAAGWYRGRGGEWVPLS